MKLNIPVQFEGPKSLPLDSGSVEARMAELRAFLTAELSDLSLRQLSLAVGHAENFFRRALEDAAPGRRFPLAAVLHALEILGMPAGYLVERLNEIWPCEPAELMACLARPDRSRERFIHDLRAAMPLVRSDDISNPRPRQVHLAEVENLRFGNSKAAKVELERRGRHLAAEAASGLAPLTLLEDLALVVAAWGSIKRLMGDKYAAARAHALAFELQLPEDSAVRANLFQRAAYVVHDFGGTRLAARYLDKSCAAYFAAGDQAGQAQTLADRGYLKGLEDEVAAARFYFEKALVRLPESEWHYRGATHQCLSRVFLASGDQKNAEKQLEMALLAFGSRGKTQHAYVTWPLGKLLQNRGNFSEAEHCYRCSLKVLEEHEVAVDRALLTIDLYCLLADAGQKSELSTLGSTLNRTLMSFSNREKKVEKLYGEFVRAAGDGPINPQVLKGFRQKVGELASTSTPDEL